MATVPGLIFSYRALMARFIASPERFSPTATSKPARFSSSAIARMSLTGSFSGASLSGYFALPITSAKRPSAASTRLIVTSDRIRKRTATRRILMLTPIQVPCKQA
jgi:hypothetical protein